MLGKRIREGLTAFLGISMFVPLSSAGASEPDGPRRAGPEILAVIEDVRDMIGNSCPVQLPVRRFVLGNPAGHFGERISVCPEEAVSTEPCAELP